MYYPNATAGISPMISMKILKNRQYGLIGSTNLCKEIFLPMDVGVFYAPYIPKAMPKTKYNFSRAKWYEANLFTSDYTMDEVREWCVEQFGPQDHNPDAWSRWTNYMNSTFRFRDEKDYMWFSLKWSE